MIPTFYEWWFVNEPSSYYHCARIDFHAICEVQYLTGDEAQC